MADSEFETTSNALHLSKSSLERTKEADASSPSIVQKEPLDSVTCRAGDDSCAAAHASTLNRASALQAAGAGRSLLQLQRQYGNRYVERVIALARESAGPEEVSAHVEQAINRDRGGGQPLDAGVRRQMESALGADFGGVRVHTDNQAHKLNQELSAKAFTTGRDIFFSQGAYEPGSSPGRELIAHELTHVVQQSGDTVSRQFTVSQPGDAHEVEAEQTARAIMQQEQQTNSGGEEEDKQNAMAARDLKVGRQPETVENGTVQSDISHR
jgi:hypothetical protein